MSGTPVAALLRLTAAAPLLRVSAELGRLGIAPDAVRRWDGDPVPWGWLVTGRSTGPGAVTAPSSAHELFMAATAPVGAVTSGNAFIVANNVLNGRDEEFDTWYDRVHIPHTFEYFGFTSARRYVAVGPGEHRRLIVYTCGRSVTASREAMAWAASDRQNAAVEGRPPALPVSPTVVLPRHAGFYLPVD